MEGGWHRRRQHRAPRAQHRQSMCGDRAVLRKPASIVRQGQGDHHASGVTLIASTVVTQAISLMRRRRRDAAHDPSAAVHDASEVLLHAAGSLRAALTEVAEGLREGERQHGARHVWRIRHAARPDRRRRARGSVRIRQHGASAVACDAGKSSPVVLFARNRLCALVRPGLAVTPATLLEQMLSPNVKVGTSTPKADPSGDYAFEVFAKAEALKAGSQGRTGGEGAQAFRRAGQRAAARGPQPLRLARRRGPRRHLSLLLHGRVRGAARESGPADRGAARSARGRRGLRAHRHEWRACGSPSLRFVCTLRHGTAYSGAARLFRAIARAIGRNARTE